MTGNKAPVALAKAGKTVCSCVGVNDIAILEHLKLSEGVHDQKLTSLQSVLKCGTQCGSCVPELRRMIGQAEVVADIT
jgi:assimilatory nitrate reductase catalytic subunit